MRLIYFFSCMDVIDFVRQIDDSDRFLFSICDTGEQIANLKNYNYIVKPTGLDDYAVVLKEDAIEIVYFYKCCLEDALGIFPKKHWLQVMYMIIMVNGRLILIT